MRGRGHSQYGQSQVENGIVIDSSTLNAVRLHDDGFLDAQPGALWGEVVRAALARGLTPLVMVDVPILTVGGTLSVGGTGEMTHRYGTQVDNVLELDVVTGTGEFVTCSPERNDELFHMMLAGLGQCGIIVRARLRLIRAPKVVAMRSLAYDDLDSFLGDQARLTAVESLGPMSGEVRGEPSGKPYFVLHGGSFAETAEDARQPAWMTGLRHIRELVPSIGSYWDFLRGRNPRMAGITPPADRRRSGSAALAVTLSGRSTQDVTRHVLSHAAIGIWRFEIAAKVTERHTRPLNKMPEGPVAFELRMHRLTTAPGSEDHVAMLQANHALLPRLQAAGGKIYPPYCPILSGSQWQEHYGAETWQRFAAAKKRFDPNNVLTPGAGIFSH
jgi:FAD/FMN-containing dehydrogenase